jgi:hypothetical protein
MLALTLAPAMATAMLLEQHWPGASVGWTTTIVKLTLVLAVWSLTNAVGWHFGGWSKSIRQDN